VVLELDPAASVFKFKETISPEGSGATTAPASNTAANTAANSTANSATAANSTANTNK
jgi:hypothetical protein